MKKLILGAALMSIVLALIVVVKPTEAKKDDACATIQGGTIVDVMGNPITIGSDEFGYNYQSHMFSGRYCDSDRVIGGAYCDVNLIMKWSDEWMSNKDCNGDGLLDRGYSCNPENPTSSACQGAWLTNHQFGSYEGEDGKTCNWNYFVKMVHPGNDAVCDTMDTKGKCIGMWHTADGEEIGPAIWGAYARILQISNDTCAGEHGVLNNWEAPTGFGFYK